MGPERRRQFNYGYLNDLRATGTAGGAHPPAVSPEALREITAIADEIAKSGGTPLAVAKDGRLLGVIQLKDIVKGGIRERFAETCAAWAFAPL